MTDTIQDRLRSGVDNCDTDSRGVELGGVVLTMRQAAAHIDAQDAKIKALVEALESIERNTDAAGQGFPIASIVQQTCRQIARAALAAAKETT